MNAIITIAGKELRDGMRNRWILAITLLMAGLALSLAFLGSAPVGGVDAGRLSITIVSLASLSIFLVPLISLMLAYDAIVGEQESGTLLLLLAYPVSRGQLLLGKFFGHVGIVLIAMVIGYGVAVTAIFLTGEGIATGEWLAFAGLVGSSVLLGAVFIAIGYVISLISSERAMAAGIAVGIWLVFVLLYDMALLGILAVDQGATLKGNLFDFLLLLNPADAFRLYNLTGSDGMRALSGMTAAAGRSQIPGYLPVLALLAWTVLPLSLAGWKFRGKEI